MIKLFNKLKLWWAVRKQEKALDKYFQVSGELFPNAYLQDSVSQAYREGLSLIAKKVNKVKDLEKVDNAIELAGYEDQQKKIFVDNLKKLFVYDKERPKEEMIDKRINNYYQLQDHVVKRQELRKRRKELHGK